MTERRVAMSWQDLALALFLPGLGHVARGWLRKGLLFISLLAVHGLAMYFAVSRGRLAWLAGPSEYWFSTSMLLVSLIGIWAIAILDLRAMIRREGEAHVVRGYLRMVSQRLSKDPKGLVGLVIVLTVVHIAIYAPFYANGNALEMNYYHSLTGPELSHPLGTDNFGRDVLDRIIFGSRVAIGVGGLATFLNILFGGVLGLLGGYFRGATDAVIMRILEIINSIPFLVLTLLIISLWGTSLTTLILVMGVFGLGPARIIRSEVLSVREKEYILAARAMGMPTRRIIFRHVFPNAIASLIVVTTMRIGGNIIMIAGMSFLGFGIKPPTPSWGAMLQQAQEYMRAAWWLAVFPGLSIIATVFGFNILGDSLRDVLDPKLK